MAQYKCTPSEQQRFIEHVDKLIELADHLGIDIFVTVCNPSDSEPNRCTSWGCYTEGESADVFSQLKTVVDEKEPLNDRPRQH